MATLHVELPDELRELAEVRAVESGHTNVNEYLASLIRADAEQDISEEMERAVLEGLTSGPAIDLTPEFWRRVKKSPR